MAELSDWSKDKVLTLTKSDSGQAKATSVLRVVFQRFQSAASHMFGEHVAYADITCLDFELNAAEIHNFIRAASLWLALPLHEMSVTHFDGTWKFSDTKTHKLSLIFGPHPANPTKTDWMNVSVQVKAAGSHWKAGLNWEADFHIDQTCLADFVGGLSHDWST